MSTVGRGVNVSGARLSPQRHPAGAAYPQAPAGMFDVRLASVPIRIPDARPIHNPVITAHAARAVGDPRQSA